MAVIGAVFVAIGEAIFSAAAAVAAAVASVVSTVVSAVGAALSYIGGLVAGIVSSIGTAFSDFYIGLSTYLEGIWTVADYAGTSFMTQLGAYVGSVYTTFSAFLDAIYFRQILMIHRIAYMVSEDYRKMWAGVYSEISKVSAALGYTSEFLYLTLRDARTLVLDVSSTMGRKYDLGEVAWLKEMNKFFKDFATTAKKYDRNPAQLFWDVDQMIVRPNVDNKATTMQVVIQSTDSALKTAVKAIEDVNRIRDDMGRIVQRLPENIREHVKPMIDGVFKYWDDWVKKDYKPSLKLIDGTLNVLSGLQEDAKRRTQSIVDRLRRPGDYLSEIDMYDIRIRTEEESKIADISTRDYGRRVRMLESSISEHEADLLEIKERGLEPIEIVPFPRPGPVEIKPSEKLPLVPRDTWFVGDY